MIKRNLRCGAAGILLIAAMPFAAIPAEAQAATCIGNPLLGAWRLNEGKSKLGQENPYIPGRFAVIAQSGNDGITALFVGNGDAPAVENWTVQFDGKSYATRGAYPRLMQWRRTDCNSFDVISLRQVLFNPSDGTVREYFPAPRVASHDHITVSTDGKSFTDTHSDEQGKQDEVLVFDRQ